MKRLELARLLAAAKRLIRHRDFVIIGSLSILGATLDPPEEMVGSIDVDLYPKSDPGRIDEIARTLGEGSAFHRRHGIYADPVSPFLPSLPEGWEERLIALRLATGVIAWCLEPHDAAVSKYVRGEKRDRLWCRAGLAHRILKANTLRARLRNTHAVEPGEIDRARAAIEMDVRDLRSTRTRETKKRSKRSQA